MYARLVTLALEPGSLSMAEDLADRAGSIMKTLEGFEDVTFFSNDAAGEYGSFSLWHTKANAEAVSQVTDLHIREAVGKIMKQPPAVHIFQVYEPGK